jgi:uncharacterized membrane protein
MPMWMKATGGLGSILVLIALLITFVKQLIALIGFITVVFKIVIILVFVALILGVGFVLLRAWNESRRKHE